MTLLYFNVANSPLNLQPNSPSEGLTYPNLFLSYVPLAIPHSSVPFTDKIIDKIYRILRIVRLRIIKIEYVNVSDLLVK